MSFKPMRTLNREDMRSLIARMLRIGRVEEHGLQAIAGSENDREIIKTHIAGFESLGITIETVINVHREIWFAAHHSGDRFYKILVSADDQEVRTTPYVGPRPGWIRGVEQCPTCGEIIKVFRILGEDLRLYEVGTKCVYCHWERGDAASYRKEPWAR